MGKVRRAKRRKIGKAWIVSFVPGIGKDLELAAAVCADNGAERVRSKEANLRAPLSKYEEPVAVKGTGVMCTPSTRSRSLSKSLQTYECAPRIPSSLLQSKSLQTY